MDSVTLPLSNSVVNVYFRLSAKAKLNKQINKGDILGHYSINNKSFNKQLLSQTNGTIRYITPMTEDGLIYRKVNVSQLVSFNPNMTQ